MSQFNTGGQGDSARSGGPSDDRIGQRGDMDWERPPSQLADASRPGGERSRSMGSEGGNRSDESWGDSARDEMSDARRSRLDREAAEPLESHADSAKEILAHAAHEIGGVAKEAGAAARELKSTASKLADRERIRAADVVEILADAVRDAGRRLMEEPRTRELGVWGDAAADRVRGASQYLRAHSGSELLSSASRLARQNPEIFLGVMATAGLALARIIKASERRPEPQVDFEGMPGGSMSPDAEGTQYGGGWAPGSRFGQPLVSDFPQNVSQGTGASAGVANTTPEDDLGTDPTPGSDRPRLTEEGL